MSADFGIASIKMVGSLIIVLALLIGLFILLSRLHLHPLSGKGFPSMRVLGNLNLGPKRSIALVEICDQWLIVGIGAESVTLLKEIPRPPEDPESQTIPQTGNGSFSSLLRFINFRGDEKNKMRTEKDA